LCGKFKPTHVIPAKAGIFFYSLAISGGKSRSRESTFIDNFFPIVNIFTYILVNTIYRFCANLHDIAVFSNDFFSILCPVQLLLFAKPADFFLNPIRLQETPKFIAHTNPEIRSKIGSRLEHQRGTAPVLTVLTTRFASLRPIERATQPPRWDCQYRWPVSEARGIASGWHPIWSASVLSALLRGAISWQRGIMGQWDVIDTVLTVLTISGAGLNFSRSTPLDNFYPASACNGLQGMRLWKLTA
jgi:hypothetical protein